ncbi:MAG: hypothetical protein ABI950_00690 [Solirubrobacteraceae bacterium]
MIAVCLATYAPDASLLARQLDSLDALEDVAWELVRLDDTAGSGAWRAFERCYERVPGGADHVAPCDQDDAWHPSKLARLCAAMDPGITLAFCDLRIVDAAGAVLSPTYWRGRRATWDDLGEMLATNVVTGAACLVRRDVLDVALPFPLELDDAFHDHWLACCALALGELRYVPEALVDYVQHPANVTGWSQASRPTDPKAAWRARAARDRERHVERPRLWARTLLERVPGVSGDKRAALERAATPRLPRVLTGALREQRDSSRTLQARRRALRGLVLGR